MIFKIERIAYEQRVPNMELQLMDDPTLRGLVIQMTRRLRVHRKVFEACEPKVTREVKTVRLTVTRPATWWDHAKRDVPLLRWLWWLEPSVVDEVVKEEHIETERVEKHYTQRVIVLDDERELPKHLETVEVPIWNRDWRN